MKLDGKTVEYHRDVYKVTGYNLLKNEYTLVGDNKYRWVDMDELEREAKVVEG